MPYKDPLKQRKRDREYYLEHREKLCAQARKSAHLLREKSIETFLVVSVRTQIFIDKKKGVECNIDLPYILNLWKLQEGLCAATHIQMTYKIGDLKCVSIDRIDSSKGHIKGNIQLVCQFYNLGKREKSDIEARSFIQEIQLDVLRRLKAQGYLKEDNLGNLNK